MKCIILYENMQLIGENMNNYHVYLRGMANYCDFAHVDRKTLTHIVLTCNFTTVSRRTLCNNKITMNELLDLAQSL